MTYIWAVARLLYLGLMAWGAKATELWLPPTQATIIQCRAVNKAVQFVLL